MWGLPGPGIAATSPALAGGIFTTEPSRKPLLCFSFGNKTVDIDYCRSLNSFYPMVVMLQKMGSKLLSDMIEVNTSLLID